MTTAQLTLAYRIGESESPEHAIDLFRDWLVERGQKELADELAEERPTAVNRPLQWRQRSYDKGYVAGRKVGLNERRFSYGTER